MLDLALHNQESPVALADIAKRQGISLSYLERLFSNLRRRGLISSVRGPGGGYKLMKAANDLSIGEVIHAVEENVDTTLCGGANNCQNNERCLTHDLWSDLGHQIRDYLYHISLHDLMNKKGVLRVAQRQDAMPNFSHSKQIDESADSQPII